tara:strand:+ start:71 stop:784 length:714 start_codon:yes stop_codon:yes gene_type:complete
MVLNKTIHFDILNNFLGSGDPSGGLWFIGLEEAGEWNKDVEKDKKSYERYKKNNYSPVPAGQIFNDAIRYKKSYTKVFDIMSKIIVGLKDADEEFRNWKNYRNNELLQHGSKVFQSNLFPIGKRKFNQWPEHYGNLFGFQKWDYKYEETVKKTRFPNIYQLWKNSTPQATICFGSSGWHYSEELFGLKTANFKEAGDCFRIYEKHKIIFTKFFNPQQTGDKRIRYIIEVLQEWCVTI